MVAPSQSKPSLPVNRLIKNSEVSSASVETATHPIIGVPRIFKVKVTLNQ